MKRSLFTLLLLLPALALAQTSVRVATYNIKFLDADKVDDQGDRKTKFENVLEQLDTDVIGLQEIDDRAALEDFR